MRRPAFNAGRARHIAVVGLLGVAITVLLLTSQQLSWLRHALPSLRLMISRLEHLDTPFDMTHVVFFALLAFALRMLLPGMRWWRLLLGCAVLAGATELLQSFTIGRTPRLLDVRDGVVGAGIGLLAGSVPLLLVQWWQRAKPRRSGDEPVVHPQVRQRLARLIAGDSREERGPSVEPDRDALVIAAEAEGVTALLAGSLLRAGWHARELPGNLFERARELAKMELGQHAALVAVLARLHAAGIPVLVLKGTALRCWLYPEPHLRESSDLDLLFATREQAMAAVAALQPMGYAAPYSPGRFAHEILCRHALNRVDLDLHWGLSRNPAMAFLPGFEALRSRAQSLPALGSAAMGLGQVDALLHACVHRASNLEGGLGDRLKWLFDVHLLASRFDAGGWDEFVVACRAARVSGIARDALEATSTLFSTVLSSAAMEQLQAGIADDAVDARRLQDWGYLQRQSLRALPDLPTRVAWLWDRVFPTSGYMRELYGRDLSRAGLLWSRFGRLFGRMG